MSESSSVCSDASLPSLTTCQRYRGHLPLTISETRTHSEQRAQHLGETFILVQAERGLATLTLLPPPPAPACQPDGVLQPGDGRRAAAFCCLAKVNIMARWNRSRTESRGPRPQGDANTLPELGEFRPAWCEVCPVGQALVLKCHLFVSGAVGAATLQHQALKYQPSSQLAASFMCPVFVFYYERPAKMVDLSNFPCC